MVGDHKAFLSADECVPFAFRHYSDTKKYMEQYRKFHTKGDIYQRQVGKLHVQIKWGKTWERQFRVERGIIMTEYP